ncbi:MAG TPA: hypothetical protein VEB23_04965 [Ramlibacter sp.]|uniref:hypothetical protein n=1 Tax=Ramlibacter sp. TaxID=1917967 RepID=UPI002D6A3F66|nr:hypothetical protein [Ramlibacter sp.]HYD75751.1 hypothetical protein [Ramlibacter sp.]HYE39259.1 hypothetical protein [Ramlibacter sp.]
MKTVFEIAQMVARFREIAADHERFEQGGGCSRELGQAADAIELMAAHLANAGGQDGEGVLAAVADIAAR